MQVLQRKEQEQVVLTFEKDYGNLILKKNNGLLQDIIEVSAQALLVQINKANKSSYFEDDLLEYLEEIALSIRQRILH